MAFSRGMEGAGGLVALISARVLLANAAVCAVLSGLLALHSGHAAAGFAAGFLTGTLSVYWLMRIARKGMAMSPEKVGRFVTAAYYIRFAAVAAIFSIAIAKGYFTPWPLVAGLTGSVVTTICTMIYLAREEASHA